MHINSLFKISEVSASYNGKLVLERVSFEVRAGDFIGIRGPETGSNYLEVDTEHEFEIATVKNTGEPISVNDLEYEVYKLDWSWWYGSNNRNLASLFYFTSQHCAPFSYGDSRISNSLSIMPSMSVLKGITEPKS